MNFFINTALLICNSDLTLQPNNLLIQHCELFTYDSVGVVMAQEPISELAPFCHLIQEVRQCVSLVKSPAQFILHRGRPAVGDDVVHLPVVLLQAGPGGPVFFLAGQLLFPPGAVVHPVQRSPVIQHPAFPLELRIVRLQDAAADIVAAGAAHREEGLALDIVDLTPQQVNHRTALIFPALCTITPWLISKTRRIF